MTLAHELQHAIQHDKVRKLWAVNSLVRTLPSAVDELKLEWADIPIERDARIVVKRVALDLHGEQQVRTYIDKRSAEAVEPLVGVFAVNEEKTAVKPISSRVAEVLSQNEKVKLAAVQPCRCFADRGNELFDDY